MPTASSSPAGDGAITPARLHAFAPASACFVLAPALTAAAKWFALTTPRQVRHWLAQLHNETGGFTRFEEDLDYSAAELMKVWPSHFPTASIAGAFAHNPAVIANRAYGGRNGNADPGDGYLFRGRGMIQLTGRANYTGAGQRLGRPYLSQPDLVAAAPDAALTAADFWAQHHGDQILADHADETEACTALRRMINGGAIGLPNTLIQLKRAAAIWPG